MNTEKHGSNHRASVCLRTMGLAASAASRPALRANRTIRSPESNALESTMVMNGAHLTPGSGWYRAEAAIVRLLYPGFSVLIRVRKRMLAYL